MWGEGINAGNSPAFVWRGTSAVAERLWSPYNATPSHDLAVNRLVEHVCRLQLLGIRAGPIEPSFCPSDVVMPDDAAAIFFPSAEQRIAADALEVIAGALEGAGAGKNVDDAVQVSLTKAQAEALLASLRRG